MAEGHDTRIEPLPAIELASAHYAGIRVWKASRPVYDDSPVKERGTVGWHVHAYNLDGSGKKVIDDTYRAVKVDGRVVGKAQVPTLGDVIEGKMRQGEALEGCWYPKLNLVRWTLGGRPVHGRAVNGLIENNRVVVTAGAFPFTNARKGTLRVR